MANIVTTGFVTPIGMNGFQTKTRRFIRFFPGYKVPISHKTATIIGLKSTSDWFIDKELRVYLKWCAEGYYEMSTKDSERFNELHSPNRERFIDNASIATMESSSLKRKCESDTPTHRYPAALEGLYWSTGTSEGDRSPASSCTVPRAKRPKGAEEGSENNPRLSGSARTSPASTPPTVLSKGDTVFITKGSYRNERGKVVGQLGANAMFYKVEVAGRTSAEDPRILKIPRDSISLTQPHPENAAASTEDDAITGSAAEPPVSVPSTTASSTTAPTTGASLDTGAAGEDDDGLDEFFDNLSQTSLRSDPAAATMPALSARKKQQSPLEVTCTSSTMPGAKSPSSSNSASLPPAAATSLPASPLPFSPTASPKPSLRKSEHPRRQTLAMPKHPLSASIRIGDAVRVLEGEFRDQRGVVAGSLKVTSAGLACCVRLQGESDGAVTHCLPVAQLECVRAASTSATQLSAVPG